MPQPEHLNPNSYAADRGPVGILLIHGYTGSVAETRPMGEFLSGKGLTVRCPLLSGHGTVPEDIGRIRWQAWAGEVESSLHDLESRCDTIFVGGLSMGALLALWLGTEHRDIAGLVPMAPALVFKNRLAALTPGLRYLVKNSPLGPLGDDDLVDPEGIDRIWAYDELPLWGAGETYTLHRHVRQLLPKIRQPVLIFQGRRDAQLKTRAAQILYDEVNSRDKKLIWLENSGHNLLADGERESVWTQTHDWMMKRVKHA